MNCLQLTHKTKPKAPQLDLVGRPYRCEFCCFHPDDVGCLSIQILQPAFDKMDIRGAVDAAVPTNIIAAKAAEVRANQVNWQSYLQ